MFLEGKVTYIKLQKNKLLQQTSCHMHLFLCVSPLMEAHASHFHPNRYPWGQALDSWCVQWGISEKRFVFATHINIEKEKTQTVYAREQPNEPSSLLRIPEERSVCRRKKRTVATLACEGWWIKIFSESFACKFTLAMLELIGQTQAQAEALAREWCCWDAIDTGSFVKGQWNPPCLQFWYWENWIFLSGCWLGMYRIIYFNHPREPWHIDWTWWDFLLASSPFSEVFVDLRSKFRSSEDVAKLARRLRRFPTNQRPRCCSVSFCVCKGYPQKLAKQKRNLRTCHYQKIVSSINYSDLFCHYTS